MFFWVLTTAPWRCLEIKTCPRSFCLSVEPHSRPEIVHQGSDSTFVQPPGESGSSSSSRCILLWTSSKPCWRYSGRLISSTGSAPKERSEWKEQSAKVASYFPTTLRPANFVSNNNSPSRATSASRPWLTLSGCTRVSYALKAFRSKSPRSNGRVRAPWRLSCRTTISVSKSALQCQTVHNYHV